jgi:hypothetical protein
MDDMADTETLRTFFDGQIGCIEYTEAWQQELEEFCSVAKDLGYVSNESLEAMKVDKVKYHCMVHMPTNKIYAVGGVEHMPEYKEGYYRVWTRLARIPNPDIPMNYRARFDRAIMPEFDGLLYFNCDWASKQDDFVATFGTTLANKAYSGNYVKSTVQITDYIKRNWWKRKGIAEPEGIFEFYKVPQVSWKIHHDKFKEMSDEKIHKANSIQR